MGRLFHWLRHDWTDWGTIEVTDYCVYQKRYCKVCKQCEIINIGPSYDVTIGE